jgi:hypothetical protein
MADFFPTASNLTGFDKIMQYNNTVTNDFFGVTLLMIVFSISFISLYGFGKKPAFVASLWLTTVISIFSWVMSIVSPDIMVMLAVVTAMASLFLFRTREN